VPNPVPVLGVSARRPPSLLRLKTCQIWCFFFPREMIGGSLCDIYCFRTLSLSFLHNKFFVTAFIPLKISPHPNQCVHGIRPSSGTTMQRVFPPPPFISPRLSGTIPSRFQFHGEPSFPHRLIVSHEYVKKTHLQMFLSEVPCSVFFLTLFKSRFLPLRQPSPWRFPRRESTFARFPSSPFSSLVP